MGPRSWLIGVGFAGVVASGCGGGLGESPPTADADAGDAGSSGPSTSSGDAGGVPEAGSPLKLGEVKVSAPSKATTSEDGGTTTFTVALGSKPNAKVSLALVVDKPGEAELDKTILTFDATNYAEPQTVTVTGKDDEVDDGDVPYAVVFAMASSSDPAYAGVSPGPVLLTNIDNDTAGLVVSAPTKPFTTENGGTMTFTVRLRSKPSANVTVPIASTKPTEGTVDKPNLIFTPANYETEQTVTVTGADDAKPDGDAVYKVTVGKTTSADAGYRDLEASVGLTNVDDETPTTVQLACTAGSTCVRFLDGTVKCWGRNDYGQLGYGDTSFRGDDANEMGANLPFVNLGTNRTAKLLATGSSSDGFQCAILDNDQVKCWGLNHYGELGYGDTTWRGDDANEMGDSLPYVDLGAGRTAKAVTMGFYHACALLDDDQVKCWGDNSLGQLGYGDTNARGDEANEMGDNLAGVDLGAGRRAKTISAGGSHTCALLDNDRVKCWGENYFGDLGCGDTKRRGDNANEMGDNLPYVDLGNGRTVKSLLARASGACAILDDDTLKCWGYGGNGRLGIGGIGARGSDPIGMGNNLPAVNLGAGRKAIAIFGYCAALDDGSLKCWGENNEGQLGYGDTNDRGDEPNEMGDNLPRVDLGSPFKATLVASGYSHTCAILENRTVKCWGYNVWGSLGYGDPYNRGDAPGEMGDNLPVVLLK